MKKTIFWLGLSVNLLAILGGCAQKAPTRSGLNAIYTGDESGQGFIDILGYEDPTDATRRYFVAAGNNLHVVYDCASDKEIFGLLDSSSDKKLDARSLDAILLDETSRYTQGADLSCKGSFLPRTAGTLAELDQTLYFDSELYYFTTGTSSQEYYSVSASNAACVYDFAAKLFGFEQRADTMIYSKPADATRVINLSCKDNTKSRYDLFLFSPQVGGRLNIPFKQLLILTYEDKAADGSIINTLLPIDRIDGVFIDDSNTNKARVIANLKQTYKVGDPKVYSLSNLPKLGGRLLYDFCLDKCGPGFKPVHELFNLVTTRNPPIVELKPLPANAKALALPDLKGQQIVQWQVDDRNSIQFVGCEQDLLPNLGLIGSENLWFASLRQQALGQIKVSGPSFSCPRIAQPTRCEKILDKNYYSSADFTKLLEDSSSCAGATQIKIRIDSDIIVEGTEPIRLGSNVPFSAISFEPLVANDRRRITYRYSCLNKPACQPVATQSEVRAWAVSSGKTLDIRNVDLLAAVNANNTLSDADLTTLRFAGIEASNGAKVILSHSNILRSDVKGRNLWTTGVRLISVLTDPDGFPLPKAERSRLNCQNCSIETDAIAIDSQDSQILVNGLSKNPSLLALATGLSLKGNSEAILVQTKIASDTLLSMGSSAKAFGYNLNLKLTGDTSTHPVSAIRFLSRAWKEAFTVDLQASEIHGLPSQQVSAFRLADFSQSDGTATLNLGAIQLFRNQPGAVGETLLGNDQIGIFLRCEGKGRVLYRFKNYCE